MKRSRWRGEAGALMSVSCAGRGLFIEGDGYASRLKQFVFMEVRKGIQD